ncbi:hypothetical protein LCGC14_1545350 [marine sediment metagenome]|uniref:Uncharacterized protein n=1 Tax=marine sediment metagenome TaxID=412755 RepID=A0A0F9IRV3_9ZZZZ
MLGVGRNAITGWGVGGFVVLIPVFSRIFLLTA